MVLTDENIQWFKCFTVTESKKELLPLREQFCQSQLNGNSISDSTFYRLLKMAGFNFRVQISIPKGKNSQQIKFIGSVSLEMCLKYFERVN